MPIKMQIPLTNHRSSSQIQSSNKRREWAVSVLAFLGSGAHFLEIFEQCVMIELWCVGWRSLLVTHSESSSASPPREKGEKIAGICPLENTLEMLFLMLQSSIYRCEFTLKIDFWTLFGHGVNNTEHYSYQLWTPEVTTTPVMSPVKWWWWWWPG